VPVLGESCWFFNTFYACGVGGGGGGRAKLVRVSFSASVRWDYPPGNRCVSLLYRFILGTTLKFEAHRFCVDIVGLALMN
jgi:hypothetical protein